MSKIEQKNKRKTIKLGASIKNISIHKLIDFLIMAHKRVNIEFTDLKLLK